MEKLMFISKDSIFAGSILSKTAEIIDSLATVLTGDYDVYIVTLNSEVISLARKTASLKILDENKQKIKFSKVTYYLVTEKAWDDEVEKIINDIQPDIIHNFSSSDIIDKVHYPLKRSVYTFNYIEDIKNYDDLSKYDFVTTISETYANTIQNDINNLQSLPTALLKNIFAPEKGFLLPKSYGVNNLVNKDFCKKTFLLSHGIANKNVPIFLIAGIHPEENLKDIIEAIPLIQEKGGLLVIATKSNIFYESLLSKYTKKDGIIYFSKYPSIVQIPTLLGASDFYLHPKSKIAGNLLPMLAGNYGAIPLLALDKHSTEDYFNGNNAFIVNNNLNDKILEAFQLYEDKEAFLLKRQTAMSSIPAWTDEKEAYINLYK